MADYPSRIDIVCSGDYHQISANPPVRDGSNVYTLGGRIYGYATGPNEVGWHVPLRSGTWSLYVAHSTAADNGIWDFRIDSTSIGTYDAYAASPSLHAFTSLTGWKVAPSGVKLLSLYVNTKNASSSSYRYSISAITLIRTGD